MDAPDLIGMVIPIWLLLILVEMLVSGVLKRRFYRINDTVNSLSLGIVLTISSVLTKVVGIATYVAVSEYALFDLPDNAWWVWVLGFVMYDLCYYWNHRMGHEVNILWAAHSVHHQSEEYNLSTGLRQTSMTFIFSWIFYTPMALLGVSPYVFVVAGALDLIYQFWIHTRFIPKLGWLEKILVTPSSHRAHHGSNKVYTDRNYGGVFIIWDRLFGSYQPELDNDPVRYGISQPLRSWNPLWANAVGYVQLFKDAWHAKRWSDKITIWFRRTGWRPADVAAQYPITKRGEHYTNYDANPGPWVSVYGALQFVVLTLLGFGFLWVTSTQGLMFNVIMVIAFTLQLTLIGRLFDNKSNALIIENLRLAMLVLCGYYWYQLEIISLDTLSMLLTGAVLSLGFALFTMRTLNTDNDQASILAGGTD